MLFLLNCRISGSCHGPGHATSADIPGCIKTSDDGGESDVGDKLTMSLQNMTETDLSKADQVIHLTVQRAEGLPSTSSLGKMDPYCVVLLSYHQKRTKPRENGDTDPVWEHTMRFRWTREKNIFFTIYDKKTLKEDTPIASATFELAPWLDSGRYFYGALNEFFPSEPPRVSIWD